MLSRRTFLKTAAGAVLAAGSAAAVSADISTAVTPQDKREDKMNGSDLKKSLILGMYPESLSLEDRFKLAHDIGMQGMEVSPIPDPEELKATRQAAEKAGIEIHSIIYGGWSKPLSSPDPVVAEEGAAEVSAALNQAKELGAGAVLLVPAVVNENTRYIEAYERSQAHIKKLAPLAEKLNVKLCVENVWNNFLLSPLEFARYIDEIGSPSVRAYFDVGNVVAFGWPQDWIRTLGSRIHKVHLKDFQKGPRQWVNLLDGDVNWPEVRKALAEVGYKGYVTSELKKGDEAYLRDLSSRMDKIIGADA